MSQEVHGAPESQEGPVKGSQEGLDREYDIINSYPELHFIIVEQCSLLVIKLKPMLAHIMQTG